jgi:ABC-type sugar transport system substrate-binding protein
VVNAETASAFKEITGSDALTGPTTEAALQARVAKYETTPKALLQTTPVNVKSTAGKTIALLVCGVPVCTEFGQASAVAAQKLGWKVDKINLGVSPQDIANAYNQAIADKPDVVVGSGIPRSLINKQLTTLAADNIPVIEWSSGITPVPGKLWVAVDNPLYEARGAMASELIAADANQKAHVAIFNVPQYTMSTLFAKTMQSYLPKICTGCSVSTQNEAATSIGSLGSIVTGYIQKNPDTNYVVCTFGDLCQGVGQALKAAGLSHIKVFTADPSTTNYQNIQNGLEWATSPLPIQQTGWQIVDLAARIFTHSSTANTRLQPVQLVTKITDPSSSTIGAVPNFESDYLSLWKKG